MSEAIVHEMCEGCGNVRGKFCGVIKEPAWIFEHRSGECFAKVTPERAKEIEKEIKAKKKQEES